MDNLFSRKRAEREAEALERLWLKKGFPQVRAWAAIVVEHSNDRALWGVRSNIGQLGLFLLPDKDTKIGVDFLSRRPVR